MWDHFYFQAARIWYTLVREFALEASASLVDELAEVYKAMKDGDIVAVGYIERNYIAFGLRKVKAHSAQGTEKWHL
jgi:hypothetical protein